jgi:hypothetical protein
LQELVQYLQELVQYLQELVYYLQALVYACSSNFSLFRLKIVEIRAQKKCTTGCCAFLFAVVCFYSTILN